MKKAILLTAILTVVLAALVTPAQARPLIQEPARIFVRFMPTMFRRLCVGDTLTLNIWTHWEPNPDPEPPLAPLDPVDPNQPAPTADNEPPAPGLRLTARLGSVSPNTVDTAIGLGDHYYQVTYTAENPGTETVEAVLYGDLATGTKTFEVLDNCEYELLHMGVYAMSSVDDGMTITDDAVFTSRGSFSVDRTSGDVIELKGTGTRDMVRILNGTFTEFTCLDLPRTLTGSGGLTIEGTRSLPPLASITPSLDFEPIIIPVEQLELYCYDEDGDEGYGSPLISHVLDSNVEENTPLLFSPTGGSISVNKSYPNPLGYMTYSFTIVVTGK